MKVLVIQIKMIGDVLASTVICETIKKTHPSWEVHYLVQPNTVAVIENNPFIDKIIFFEPNKHKGFFNLYQLGKQFKKENYSIIIDAYGKWESILPAFFSGAKTRIGNRKWYTTPFYTKTIVPRKNIQSSAIVHRLQLAEEIIDGEVKTVFPKIHLTPAEINLAKENMNNRLQKDCKTIMISVLGSSKNKSLPQHQMAETLDIIASQQNTQLLFNFMPNQESEAKAIFDLCKKETQQKIVFDFYTKGLRAFLAVASQCDALIGNEGGATNMAKALNVPTFTIYAPWINRTSWNIMEDTGLHDIVHLSDYKPELYLKHAKNYKKQAFEWYEMLKPELFAEKLKQFVTRITK